MGVDNLHGVLEDGGKGRERNDGDALMTKEQGHLFSIVCTELCREESLAFIRRISKAKEMRRAWPIDTVSKTRKDPIRPDVHPSPAWPGLVWSRSGVLLDGSQPMGLWRRCMQRPPWRQDQGGSECLSHHGYDEIEDRMKQRAPKKWSMPSTHVQHARWRCLYPLLASNEIVEASHAEDLIDGTHELTLESASYLAASYRTLEQARLKTRERTFCLAEKPLIRTSSKSTGPEDPGMRSLALNHGSWLQRKGTKTRTASKGISHLFHVADMKLVRCRRRLHALRTALAAECATV